MQNASYRLPESMNEKLVAAADEEGTFRSEISRRAVRYYISENPDGIRALEPESARAGGGAPADQEAGEEGGEVELDLGPGRSGGGAPADQEADEEGGEGGGSVLDRLRGFLSAPPLDPVTGEE